LETHPQARSGASCDLAEVTRALSRAVESRHGRWGAIAEERVLDGQAHVRLRKRRLHAAVDVLDEGMHDALRVINDVDALVVEAVEPPGLDDFVALVHQRG